MKLVDPKIVGLKLLIVVPRSEKGNVSPYPGSDCYFCFRFYDWILYMKWILNFSVYIYPPVGAREHIKIQSSRKTEKTERLKRSGDSKKGIVETTSTSC